MPRPPFYLLPFAFFLPPTLAADTPTQTRPNVLLLILDDLKPDLNCYGNTSVHSPHIDALAAKSVLFEKAYCQQAVCAPSRASFLTGLRPDSTKIYDLNTPVRKALPTVTTLPQHFKNHGYETLALGKVYHHPKDDPEGWSRPPWRPTHDAPGNNPSGNDALGEDERPAKRAKPALPLDLPDEDFGDGQTAQRATAFLRDPATKSKPFFLAVGISKPHLPFVVPQKYWDLYTDAHLPLAPNPNPPKDVSPFAMTTFPELRQYVGIPKSGPLDDPTARTLLHGSRAATTFADAQVGKILAELDAQNLSSNTIIILLGDHGWHLGDHGLWTKHTNFESAVRAPLIIHAPNIPPSRTTNLAELVDLFPTLCDLTHLPKPATLEGTSLLPTLKDPTSPGKPAALSQYPRPNRNVMGYSVTDGRYRLTRWTNTKDPSTPPDLELYDHQTDPQENTNLANDPSQKQNLAYLNRLLAESRTPPRPAP